VFRRVERSTAAALSQTGSPPRGLRSGIGFELLNTKTRQHTAKHCRTNPEVLAVFSCRVPPCSAVLDVPAGALSQTGSPPRRPPIANQVPIARHRSRSQSPLGMFFVGVPAQRRGCPSSPAEIFDCSSSAHSRFASLRGIRVTAVLRSQPSMESPSSWDANGANLRVISTERIEFSCARSVAAP
jgi:hypothetical protein